MVLQQSAKTINEQLAQEKKHEDLETDGHRGRRGLGDRLRQLCARRSL